MKVKSVIGLCLAVLVMVSCSPKQQQKVTGAAEPVFVLDSVIQNAKQQIGLELKAIQDSGRILNPVTVNSGGKIYYCDYSDWRSGFFPGSIWYLSQLTGDKSLIPVAIQYTENLHEAQFITNNHDIGFIVNDSYGNGLRFANMTAYKDVIIQAAKSLCSRFREVPGVIQSWEPNKRKDWKCPVIIDNMMNLELLFNATKLSGDSTYYKVAVSHANRTLKEHFRPDGSCFHVIDYDIQNGTVRHRNTHQGAADSSAWSRGQAWAIYGFTMAYRETKDQHYLDQALKTFHYMKDNKNMPEDLIPYWDMDAPAIPNEPRDASAAAIIASALYEISTLPVDNAVSYKNFADKIMYSLSTPAYTAKLGTNGNFILEHCVGSKPHNAEVDKPLNYADYYYLEAMYRKMNIEKK